MFSSCCENQVDLEIVHLVAATLKTRIKLDLTIAYKMSSFVAVIVCQVTTKSLHGTRTWWKCLTSRRLMSCLPRFVSFLNSS